MCVLSNAVRSAMMTLNTSTYVTKPSL